MAQPTQWQFTARLPRDFQTKTLRQLLMTDWYLPKHLVFSLKRGKRVLVNTNISQSILTYIRATVST